MALIAGVAVAFGIFGALRHGEGEAINLLFFVAWSAAMLVLFALALRLPLRIAGPRHRAAAWNLALAVAALLLAYAANVAVFRHDLHLDLSREAANTPPPQFESVIDGLKTDIAMIYLYNSADENALKATELLTIASRQNPHLRFRAIDLDKEPAMARRLDVHAYNTVVVEAEDRRVVVENTVDPAQMAYAALRALKKRVDTMCFVTGHGETFSPAPPHIHYSHVETLRGHDTPGAGDVLVGTADGLDRLQLAVTTLGYTTRAIVPATLAALPEDCAVIAEIGPRRALAPSEVALMGDYLARGGRLLLAFDPDFPVTPELAALLARVGFSAQSGLVIDPLNHYGPDDDKIAVPYYPPHAITRNVALTVFPDARPLGLAHPPEGVAASILATSSEDSYLRPSASTATPVSTGSELKRGVAILAAAAEGRWPGARDDSRKPFRLVLVGNSSFATNAYFPTVSNGDLALAMLRWLAGDEGLPPVKPQRLALAQIDLTARQMRGIFFVVEILLPLSVVLLGGIVWWRRR